MARIDEPGTRLMRNVITNPLPVILIMPILLLPGGCLLPPATSNPMEFVLIEKVPGQKSDNLIVFLPGRFDQPEDFMRNAFPEQLWSRGIDADVLIADAHLGYYYERIFDDRLNADVVRPMRNSGYRQIWAVGVSLGGFGAVMFERDHPGSWDGIVLIAPFVGDQDNVLQMLRSAGSLQSVELPVARADDDYTANFWHWMQSYQQTRHVPIYLGLGKDDRMYQDQAILMQALDRNRVIELPGGHNWDVWTRLWGELLDMWLAE